MISEGRNCGWWFELEPDNGKIKASREVAIRSLA
jgi:hypothetical protein